MNHFKPLKIIPFILLPALIFACGVSGAPDCDDASVTSLVKEITLNSIKDDYAKYYSPYAEGMKYKTLKEAVANGSDFLAENLADVEKDSREAQINISGIRTQSQNHEIQKSECTCQLTINRKNALTKQPSTVSASVNYSAQYSGDGQVYVEVFGL
jgi:hypothetical protein